MNFEARLDDGTGKCIVKRGQTKEEAVNLAFRELMSKFSEGQDVRDFDGEIRDIQVWWHNRNWGLIGTVTPVGSDKLARIRELSEVTTPFRWNKSYTSEESTVLDSMLFKITEFIIEEKTGLGLAYLHIESCLYTAFPSDDHWIWEIVEPYRTREQVRMELDEDDGEDEDFNWETLAGKA